MAICRKWLEHSVVFPVYLVLKQIASYVSADTLLLKFPRMKFFLIHPGNWNIFLEGLKVLMKGKASQVIKIFSFSFIFQVL